MENKKNIAEAQFLFINESYTEALAAFNKLIDKSPTYDYDLLIYRALTHWKLNNYKELTGDAERVNSLNNGRYEGFYLQAVGLTGQGKYADALKAINNAKIRLASLDLGDQRKQLIHSWERKIELEKARFENIGTPKADVLRMISGPAIPYEWRQNESTITIDIHFVLLKKDTFKIKFDKRTVDIFFPINDSKSFELTLQLFGEILPENSKYQILLEQIEITLEKKNKKKWGALENADSENEVIPESMGPKQISSSKPAKTMPSTVQTSSSTTTTSSTTSSNLPVTNPYSKPPKDWSKLEKEIEEEEEIEKKNKEEENKDEGNQGIDMNAFMKMYEQADDKTKEELMKAISDQDGGISFNMNKGRMQPKNDPRYDSRSDRKREEARRRDEERRNEDLKRREEMRKQKK